MSERILLVEDDHATIEVIKEELQLLGYQVMTARNGAEAVEKASADLPDLIVMDIRMPKMSGLEAASRIRKEPKTKAIPILAATAKALPGDKDICLSSGCDDYISKPFTYKELDAAVKKLLHKQSK